MKRACDACIYRSWDCNDPDGICTNKSKVVCKPPERKGFVRVRKFVATKKYSRGMAFIRLRFSVKNHSDAINKALADYELQMNEIDDRQK